MHQNPLVLETGNTEAEKPIQQPAVLPQAQSLEAGQPLVEAPQGQFLEADQSLAIPPSTTPEGKAVTLYPFPADVWLVILRHLPPTDLWRFAVLCKGLNFLLNGDSFKKYWHGRWTQLLAFTNAKDPIHEIYTANAPDFEYYTDFWKRLKKEFFKTSDMESKQACLTNFGPEVLLLKDMLSPQTITIPLPPSQFHPAPAANADPNAPNPNQVHLTPMTLVLAAGQLKLFQELQVESERGKRELFISDDDYVMRLSLGLYDQEETVQKTLATLNDLKGKPDESQPLDLYVTQLATHYFAKSFFQHPHVAVNPLTALHLFDQKALILYLLKHFSEFISPDAPCRMTGTRTILEDACWLGDTELVMALISHPKIKFEGEVHPAMRAFDGGHMDLCDAILRSPHLKVELQDRWSTDLLRKIVKSKNRSLLTTMLTLLFSKNCDTIGAFDIVMEECLKANDLDDVQALVEQCPDPWALRANIFLSVENPVPGKLPLQTTSWVEVACQKNNLVFCQMLLNAAPTVEKGCQFAAKQGEEFVGVKLNFLTPEELEAALNHFNNGQCTFFPDLFKNPNQGLSTKAIAVGLVFAGMRGQFLPALLDNPTFCRHDALEQIWGNRAIHDRLVVLLQHPATDVNYVLLNEKKSLIQVCCEINCGGDSFVPQLITTIWKTRRHDISTENLHHIIRWAFRHECFDIIRECNEDQICAAGIPGAEKRLLDMPVARLRRFTQAQVPLPFKEGTDPFALALQATSEQEDRLLFLIQDLQLKPITQLEHGNTVLHICVQRGFTRLLEALHKQDPQLLCVKNAAGQTPLDLACEQDNFPAIFILFDEAAIRANLNTPSKKDGRSLAHRLMTNAAPLGRQLTFITAESLDLHYRDPQGRNYAHIVSEQPEMESLINGILERAPELFNEKSGEPLQPPALVLLKRADLPADLRKRIFMNLSDDLADNFPTVKQFKAGIQHCLSPQTKLGFTKFVRFQRAWCLTDSDAFQVCVQNQLKQELSPQWKKLFENCLVKCDAATENCRNQIINELLEYVTHKNGHADRVDSLLVDIVSARSLEDLREVIAIQKRIHSGDTTDCDSSVRHLMPMKHAQMHFKFWRLLKEFENLLKEDPELDDAFEPSLGCRKK